MAEVFQNFWGDSETQVLRWFRDTTGQIWRIIELHTTKSTKKVGHSVWSNRLFSNNPCE